MVAGYDSAFNSSLYFFKAVAQNWDQIKSRMLKIIFMFTLIGHI